MTKGRFNREDVDGIVEDAWRRFATLRPRIPREPNVGARLWLLNGALIIGAIQAAIASGIERGYAIELIGDAAWRIYRDTMRIPDFFVRLMTSDGVERIRRDTRLIMNVFPFGPPSYEKRWIDSDRGGVFEVTRCPYADLHRILLAPRDARDFCQGTACNQDYALAEMWGGHLTRTGTLAGGAPCCDFAYLAGERAGVPRTGSASANSRADTGHAEAGRDASRKTADERTNEPAQRPRPISPRII